MLNIVLVEPEIPQNTGNVSRTCACTHSRLHLVRPFGFEISDRALKRAGLDYWDKLEIFCYDSFAELREKFPKGEFFYASSKAAKSYTDISYPDESFLVFGKETKGLPETLIRENFDRAIRIPMYEGIRCLNLSNAVAIVTYEALRQNGFYKMK